MLVLMALLACEPGPNPATLIEELRVVGMMADPPEVSPGQAWALDVHVANPLELGAELAVWTCTDFGDGCIEEETGASNAQVLDLTEGLAQTDLLAPAALAAITQGSDSPVMATLAWALACEPGLCPLVDDIAEGTVAAEDLADPSSWLAELPIEGVNLGLKVLAVSEREAVHTNPVVVDGPDTALQVEPGGARTLTFQVESAPGATVTAYGYTTAGGFGMGDGVGVYDGYGVLTWFAPETDAETDADLWVVFVDDLGGSTMWTGSAQVR